MTNMFSRHVENGGLGSRNLEAVVQRVADLQVPPSSRKGGASSQVHAGGGRAPGKMQS